MEEVSTKSQKRTDKRGITGDAATDSVLWRLSLVLREIAESTTGDVVQWKIHEGGKERCETDAHKRKNAQKK